MADEGQGAYGRPSRGTGGGRGSARREPPPADWDEYTNPVEEPRGRQGMRSSDRGGSRRSGGSDGSRGRGVPYYDEGPARPRGPSRYEPTGYTEEEAAIAGYDAGYSEEYPAPPRSSGGGRGSYDSRAPRSAPRSGRSPSGSRYAPYEDDANEDARAYGGRGGPSGRNSRPPRYDEPSGYTDVGETYPGGGGGGRDDFGGGWGPPRGGPPAVRDDWAPAYRSAPVSVDAPGASRGRGGAMREDSGKKSGFGTLRLAFSLLSTLLVLAALIVEVGPKVEAYLSHGGQSGQQGASAFATYTPGATPTDIPGYKLYVSKTNHYAMDYPSTWGVSDLAGGSSGQTDTVDQFVVPGGGTQVNVELAKAFASMTDAQIIQTEVQAAQSKNTTFTEITSAATTEGIGGEVWQRHEYQATDKSGAKAHVALLVCHHLGQGYVIALFSSDTGFAKNDTTIFEPMVKSFRFM